MNCKILMLLALSAITSVLGAAPASARSSTAYLLPSQSAGLASEIFQPRLSGKNILGAKQDRFALMVSQADLSTVEGDVRAKPFSWSFERRETGEVSLTGNVPSEGLANFLLIRAGKDARQTLSVAGGAPQGFNGAAIAAITAVKALLFGTASFENGAWSLHGIADSLATRQSLLEDLAKSADLNQWNIVIQVLPRSQELNDTNANPGDPVVALQACTNAVEDIGKGQAILFAPASSKLTEQSVEILRELGAKLQNCPEAQIHVQGHTDADGPADTNMTLSVMRAEAVVSALIEAGVSDTRLYAIGFGETLPVASNQTRAGKAQNRRIVIELVQE